MPPTRNASPSPLGGRKPDDPRTILSLETRPTPEVVRIDGVAYDMTTLGELSLNERHELKNLFERTRALEGIKPERRTPDDDAEYRQRIGELAPYALRKAPPELIAKLPLEQQEALIAAFFVKRIGPRWEALMGAMFLPSRSIRRTSLRSSRGRTAGIRRAG